MKDYNFSGARYCGMTEANGEYKRGRNWHWAILDGTSRSYRCTCMPTFRLPDGKNGPNGFSRKNAWKSRPSKYNIGKNLPGFN